MNRDDEEGKRVANQLRDDIRRLRELHEATYPKERPVTLRLIDPNGGPPMPPQIAAPLNDLQLVALMAAILAVPSDDTNEEWAAVATTRAVTLLGHTCHAHGAGRISGTIAAAIQHGQTAAREAADAAERQQRGDG